MAKGSLGDRWQLGEVWVRGLQQTYLLTLAEMVEREDALLWGPRLQASSSTEGTTSTHRPKAPMMSECSLPT